MAWHVEIGMEFIGGLSDSEVLELYTQGKIDRFTLVRRSEVRPIRYFLLSEILGEISPEEVKKGEPEPPKTIEVYRPLHSELRRGHTPEFLSTTEQRKEDIQRFLARKAAGFSEKR